MLTQTLRRLEDAGLVTRTIYPAVPLHVEYDLTALGRSVAVPLDALRVWVEANVDRSGFAQSTELNAATSRWKVEDLAGNFTGGPTLRG